MKRQTLTTTAIRRGFTLTELLIVMAILVLLVSLIGPRLLGSKQKADVNAVKTQIGMFQSALERYAVDMNKFPATEEGLNALVANPAQQVVRDPPVVSQRKRVVLQRVATRLVARGTAPI